MYCKRIFIISTMGLFSGDGTGIAARILQSYGAQIIGGLHIKMPDCICDEKALKRSYEKNKQLIEHANKKIKAAAERLHENNPTKEGLGFLYHMAGLFGQRLWFYNKTKHYTDNVKIDDSACIRCGICTKSCPMNNLSLVQNKVVTHHQCTMCYRCANLCPQKAITILGSKVVMQNPINDLT